MKSFSQPTFMGDLSVLGMLLPTGDRLKKTSDLPSYLKKPNDWKEAGQMFHMYEHVL